MPVYEYRCKNCNREFERFLKRSDKKVVCPHCGSEELEKLFSAFGMQVKGETSSSSTSSCTSCSATSCTSCSVKR